MNLLWLHSSRFYFYGYFLCVSLQDALETRFGGREVMLCARWEKLFCWWICFSCPSYVCIFRSGSARVRSRELKCVVSSLVPRRSRLGQSWTLPWAVTSPRDTRWERVRRLRADNESRENAQGLSCVVSTNKNDDSQSICKDTAHDSSVKTSL